MIFGVDYYPEKWDRSEWESQAKLIKDGGFNTVRMGEFAWSLFEKQEGSFNFAFLDEAIDILACEDINVIFGTPTACAYHSAKRGCKNNRGALWSGDCEA